jgi:hypothetical protein
MTHANTGANPGKIPQWDQIGRSSNGQMLASSMSIASLSSELGVSSTASLTRVQ